VANGQAILVFASNADAMIATKALKDAGITAKMIPKPAGVDSPANLCLAIEAAAEALATTALSHRGVQLNVVVR
jgi:hypothetical protein